MANLKISELNPAQAVSPNDLLPVVQSVNSTLETRKVTVNKLFAAGNTPNVLVINDSNKAQYLKPVLFYVNKGGGTWGWVDSGNPTMDRYLMIPDGYDIISLETSEQDPNLTGNPGYRIKGLVPVNNGADFANWKKITITGEYVGFWGGNFPDNSLPWKWVKFGEHDINAQDQIITEYGEEYRITKYWYAVAGPFWNTLEETAPQFILRNKVWYTLFP